MTRLSAILRTTLITFAISAASCITDGEPDNYISLGNGAELPSINLTLSDGTVVTNDDLSGKCAVIVFFNTECQDCREELPKLQSAFETTCDKALWMAIARDQRAEDIEKFWNDKQLSIPYSPQNDRSIFDKFASAGIPRIYIADNLIISANYGPENIPQPEDLTKTIIDITDAK